MSGISQSIVPEQRARDRISRRSMGEITNRSGASPTGVNAGNDDTRNAVRDAATVLCDGAVEQVIVVRSVDDRYRADCEAGTKDRFWPHSVLSSTVPVRP